MSKRASRGRSRPNAAFVIMAVVVVALMVGGALAAILPIGGSSDDSSNDAPAIQVTPGAEVAKLETQVAANPSDADTIVVLSEVLANSGRLSESYQWFERAVSLRPDDADLRLAFGRALLRGEQWFDAELQLTRANELDPANAATAFSLGQLADQRPGGDQAVARDWYQQSIDRDPESLMAQQARTRLAELGGDSATPSASPGR
ncbi:MAG TPA: hypothetical protein PKA95_08625 [Thermomicrobiales bacterium]|nr:hypothetical protein [Thermomicrobiales bacterium]